MKKKSVLISASAFAGAMLLALGGVMPANAVWQQVNWNYTAPNCTGTSMHGENDVINGGLGGVRGATSRTQDICTPGTAHITGVDVRVGSSIAVYASTARFQNGQNWGNVQVLSGGTRHYYASTSRSLAAIW